MNTNLSLLDAQILLFFVVENVLFSSEVPKKYILVDYELQGKSCRFWSIKTWDGWIIGSSHLLNIITTLIYMIRAMFIALE